MYSVLRNNSLKLVVKVADVILAESQRLAAHKESQAEGVILITSHMHLLLAISDDSGQRTYKKHEDIITAI
ncbi:hypothetical protein N7512_009052 [Penicillium capsulatum]|nr:hypothetical protein N7512_009052 [Penicillium capsulatum]